MSEFPKIRTAIPQRRYQYGDYGVTLLGDIDSADGGDYQFIAAFVREGEARPALFIVSERTPPADRGLGSHRLRVVNNAMDEIMDVDARWGRLDDFTDQALQMGAQLLGLEQETAYPLG
ncbi:MAG: hypothetical protein QNJ91_03175 [Gammaproteobacteria bacterium]|nr:hypothetical protein [Gammaproteobacteria bacterium]